MQTVRLETLAPLGWPAVAVTIGNFDGVHRGHQALVAATVKQARSRGGTAVVLTFRPHPQAVVGQAPPARLMTEGQQARTLAALGVDRFAVLPFTPALAGESPADFARSVLAGALGARVVVVGEGFRFGRGREGSVESLRALGPEMGFDVVVAQAALQDGRPVSSTRVREALAQGDTEAARRLLGRPFAVEGEVVRGEGRGRLLGIPTANVEVENEALPALGVYAGRLAAEGGGPLPAVVNVGRRPTFGGGGVTVEAHVLDFAGDLYGRRVEVAFEARLRPERAFPGAEALVAQIREDVAAARRRLQGP